MYQTTSYLRLRDTSVSSFCHFLQFLTHLVVDAASFLVPERALLLVVDDGQVTEQQQNLHKTKDPR